MKLLTGSPFTGGKVDGRTFLIVEARFYTALADAAAAGAMAALGAAGATFERVSVPGALEIPAAIAMAEAGGAILTGMWRSAASFAGNNAL